MVAGGTVAEQAAVSAGRPALFKPGGAVAAQAAPNLVWSLAARLRQEPALGLLREGDPHLDWLDLLWGPTFDSQAALGLAASRPTVDAASLLQAGQRFDDLPSPVQHRLRRLIIRHRLSRIAYAPHLAD